VLIAASHARHRDCRTVPDLGATVDPPPASLDAVAAASHVLSRLLLAPPDGELLAATRDPRLLADWPLPSEEATLGTGLLASSAETEDGPSVRRDHLRLFVGPDRLPAPPYESVYRSADRLVFDVETFRVRSVYSRHGLAAPQLDREPDDHAGLELSFVLVLSTRAMDASDVGDVASAGCLAHELRTFLAEHLLVWGPQFAERVVQHARTEYYTGVGWLLQGYLDSARRIFSASP
jgi:putative dimethyl sulfoxide reductase chaperone